MGTSWFTLTLLPTKPHISWEKFDSRDSVPTVLYAKRRTRRNQLLNSSFAKFYISEACSCFCRTWVSLISFWRWGLSALMLLFFPSPPTTTYKSISSPLFVFLASELPFPLPLAWLGQFLLACCYPLYLHLCCDTSSQKAMEGWGRCFH